MDVAATIIELYFALMESINIRNVSIAIIIIIIGIEFIEYYISPDEEDAPETRKKKPAKKKTGGKLLRRLFGLEGRNKELLERMSEEEPSVAAPAASASPRPSLREAKELEDALPASEPGARVLGSRTYTVRTVLDGNYVYLEKIDDGER
jgi:hypothetical protein